MVRDRRSLTSLPVLLCFGTSERVYWRFPGGTGSARRLPVAAAQLPAVSCPRSPHRSRHRSRRPTPRDDIGRRGADPGTRGRPDPGAGPVHRLGHGAPATRESRGRRASGHPPERWNGAVDPLDHASGTAVSGCRDGQPRRQRREGLGPGRRLSPTRAIPRTRGRGSGTGRARRQAPGVRRPGLRRAHRALHRPGDREVRSITSQPHIWEQVLLYMAALEAYPPAELAFDGDTVGGVLAALRDAQRPG